LIALVFGIPSAKAVDFGAPDYTPLLTTPFGALVTEAIGSFFLVVMMMRIIAHSQTSAPWRWAGIGIGLTVMVNLLAFGIVTGGEVNPARAFGPLILHYIMGGSYPWGHSFIYLLGPIIGGIPGAFLYEVLLGSRGKHPFPDEEKERKKD
jgi:glycerol uptake facilitator-like aquaporin